MSCQFSHDPSVDAWTVDTIRYEIIQSDLWRSRLSCWVTDLDSLFQPVLVLTHVKLTVDPRYHFEVTAAWGSVIIAHLNSFNGPQNCCGIRQFHRSIKTTEDLQNLSADDSKADCMLLTIKSTRRGFSKMAKKKKKNWVQDRRKICWQGKLNVYLYIYSSSVSGIEASSRLFKSFILVSAPLSELRESWSALRSDSLRQTQ